MNTRICIVFSAIMISLVGSASNSAVAQSALQEQLVGTWKLVSATVERNDEKVEAFGPNPLGYFIFTANGHFSWNFMRSERPKFASNNRQTGTPEEYRAAVQGNISAFGTYMITPEGSLTLQIIGSSFPNWDGTTQRRMIEISGDQMKYFTPASSIGGSAVNILARIK
jgi:hypothetical protein